MESQTEFKALNTVDSTIYVYCPSMDFAWSKCRLSEFKNTMNDVDLVAFVQTNLVNVNVFDQLCKWCLTFNDQK